LSRHLQRRDHAVIVFILEMEAVGDIMKSALSRSAAAEGSLDEGSFDEGSLDEDDVDLSIDEDDGPLPSQSSPRYAFARARAEAMETQTRPSSAFVYQCAIEKNIYGYQDNCGRTKYQVKLFRHHEQIFVGSFRTLEEARQARNCALVNLKLQVPQTLPLPHAAPGAAALSDAGARHDACTAIDLNLKSPSAPLQPGAETSFPAQIVKTEHSPTKRLFSQTWHAGDVKHDFDRAASAHPAADTNHFACATHPAKRCIYLCIDCRKAVCEICCMSSLSGSCRGHDGHLIEDIPQLIARRHHQELIRWAARVQHLSEVFCAVGTPPNERQLLLYAFISNLPLPPLSSATPLVTSPFLHSNPPLPSFSFASTFHTRIGAEQDRVLSRVKSRVQDMFSRFMSQSLQQLHTECVSTQGPNAFIIVPFAHHHRRFLRRLLHLLTPTVFLFSFQHICRRHIRAPVACQCGCGTGGLGACAGRRRCAVAATGRRR
jgi:hypothetical protein